MRSVSVSYELWLGGDIGIVQAFPSDPFFVGEPVREEVFPAEFEGFGVKTQDGFTGTGGGIHDGFGFGVNAAEGADEEDDVGMVFAEIAEGPGDVGVGVVTDAEMVVAPFGDMEEFGVFVFGAAVVVAFAGENMDEVGIFIVVFDADEKFTHPDLGEITQSEGE